MKYAILQHGAYCFYLAFPVSDDEQAFGLRLKHEPITDKWEIAECVIWIGDLKTDITKGTFDAAYHCAIKSFARFILSA